MADNFTVLNSAAATVTFRSTDVGTGIECMMSIPTNTLGTAMIGQAVMATSLPVVVASNQSALPVSGSGDTASIYNGTTALVPTFTAVISSALGTTLVVASTAGKQIRVVALQLVAQTTVGIQWQSGTNAAVNLTGVETVADNGGYVLPYNPVGWFQTVSAQSLWLSLSATSLIGGSLTYINV